MKKSNLLANGKKFVICWKGSTDATRLEEQAAAYILPYEAYTKILEGDVQ